MATKKKTEPNTSPDLVEHEKINAAIHAVMLEVGYVFKSGKVTQGGNFSYASDGDMIKAVRPFMLKHGLILVPVKGMVHETRGDQGKSNQFLDRVMGCYELRHVHSSEVLPIDMAGSGMDVREKGVYKALTGAFKYVFRQVFMLETGDDPERDEPILGVSDADLDEAKKAAHKEGGAAGRAWVIQQLYNKRDQDDDFNGSRFHHALKGDDNDPENVALGSVEDVKMFCLWGGGRKPSHRNKKQLAELLRRLRTPAGQKKFAQFVRECGVAE